MALAGERPERSHGGSTILSGAPIGITWWISREFGRHGRDRRAAVPARPDPGHMVCQGEASAYIPVFLRNPDIVPLLRDADRQPGARHTRKPADSGYVSDPVH